MATIPGTLAVGALRHPGRVGVVFGERSYTYAGLDDAVNQAAHALGAPPRPRWMSPSPTTR